VTAAPDARARQRGVWLWAAVLTLALAVRGWNALAGPLMWGYDAWGHVAHVLFLDLYRGLPWADQGWSYFHPPLHYGLGWALAQARDAEVLVRGLALLGSAASLATAALAAWVVRGLAPTRPWLPPCAFGAVALLPVHLFMSPMPGNELTLTFLTAAAFASFVAAQREDPPRRGPDAAAGLLCGLALLTKFSGLIPLLVIEATLALESLRDRRGARRALARGLAIAAIALAIAAPWYARNWSAFGTPFQLSRDFPLVAAVERDQLPGVRHPSDFLHFPLAVFQNPDPRSPALLDSVWGTAYANVWADVFRESDVARALSAHPSAGPMALLGLGPTALFALGAGLAWRDWRRGRRRAEYGVLLVATAAALAGFAAFAWRVPIWSALKASYLLPLSLPFGVFLARGLEAVSRRGMAWRAPAGAWLGATGIAAAAVGSEGLVLPRRADAPAMGAVYYYFGEYDAARRIYARLAAGAPYPVPWLDNLAAVELAAGRSERATALAARAVALEDPVRIGHAYRRGQQALALAVAGERVAAARILDEVLAGRELPELRANRGALALAEGDAAAAERHLTAALSINPELVTAWLHLARAREQLTRSAGAEAARREALSAACRPPRRYPHGLGTGEVLEWGVGRRGLLWLDGDALRVAGPGYFRDACRRLRGSA
jgi:tetratricopeptide (TPR) repeat protein